MSNGNNSSSAGGGVGFAALLFLLFLGLKLGHVITWSWWWVTAPLWGPPALFLAVIAVCALIAGLAAIGVQVSKDRERRKRAASLRD